MKNNDRVFNCEQELDRDEKHQLWPIFTSRDKTPFSDNRQRLLGKRGDLIP